MVFETVVATVVNQFLGEYIANLETKQLSLGIWSGDVVLHNLRLKKDALSKLNLPIDVIDGSLGELTLSIPWSDLKGKPLKVAINNLYILAAPKASADYDPVDEEKNAQILKKKKLAAAEQMLSRAKSSGTEESSFLTQLTTKLLDNLQLSISNIHIRYEDSSVSTKIPFSVGFTLSELSAVSTDADWKEGFITVDHPCIYKFFRLSQLGMYWETSSKSFTEADDISQIFSTTIARDSQVAASQQFILNPVSGEGKLTWQKVYNPNTPKTDLQLIFDEFAFNLDEEQYSTFIELFGSFSRYMKSYPYRMFRPPRSITPKMDPRAWLQFAAKSIIHDIHEKKRRWSWDFFRERRDLRLEYISYYMQLKSGTLDYEGEEELDQLEMLLSFDDIRLYRHLAVNALKKEITGPVIATTAPATSGTWVGWLTGSQTPVSPSNSDTASLTNPQGSTGGAFSAADVRQLYEAIEFDPNSVSRSDYPDNFVQLSVHWKLRSGSLTLRRDPKTQAVDLFSSTFEGMAVSLCQYPHSMEINMALEKVVVVENVYAQSLHSTLIRAKRHNSIDLENSSLTSPFFSIKFEHKPLDGSVDDALTVKMLPLEIVLNPYALRTLVDFFSPKKDEYDAIYTLQAVAQDAIQEVTTQTRTNLEFAIEGHRSLNLKIEVDAPIFLIPTNFIDEKAPILVIDAGHLSVKSIPISMATKELLQNEGSSKLHDLEKFLYDQYLVDFTSVQVLVVAGIDEYHLVMDGELLDQISFMEKVDVSLSVGVSILPKAYEYAKLKVDGQLPRLHVNFSNYNHSVLMAVLESSKKAFSRPTIATVPALNPPSKSKSEEWYRALTSTSAPLIPTDSDDEFHDAQETISSPVQANSNLYFKSTLVLFSFNCHQVSVTVRTVSDSSTTKQTDLAMLSMRGFQISVTQRPFDMQAKCSLKSISIENPMLPESSPFRCLVGSSICDDSIDSSTIDSSHLVKIEFDSIQPASPDYAGISMLISVNFNSTRFVISREWIQRMYVFSTDILRRPESLNSAQVVSDLPSDSSEIPSDSNEFDNVSMETEMSGSSLVFNLNVKSVETIVLENDHRIASGKFESLVIQAKLCGGNSVVNGTLGRLSIVDDLAAPDQPLLRDFLIVEEDQTAEFFFEILDATESRRAGYDSFLKLRAASLKITYLNAFIGRLYAYFCKFQEMQALMDNARKVVEKSAIQMQQRAGRFAFDVVLRTPILVLPKIATLDRLVLYLGEIAAKNSVVSPVSDIGVALDDEHRIKVESMRIVSVFSENADHPLPMVDKVDLDLVASIFHDSLPGVPKKQIIITFSPVIFNLTDDQYQLTVDIWRAFNAVSEAPATQSPSNLKSVQSPESAEPIAPVLQTVLTSISVHIPSIILNSFSGTTKLMTSIEEKSLAKFAGSSANVKLQMCDKGMMDVELRFRSLSLYDTRVNEPTCFRDIMTPTEETDDQFVMHYSSYPMSSGLVLTIDHPKLIFDLDHIFGVRAFFARPWGSPANENSKAVSRNDSSDDFGNVSQQSTFTFRVNFVDPEIILIRDSTSPSTDAVVLLIDRLVLSQDQILAISFHDLGMYFCTMDARDKTQLRFIENFDATLSLDSRQTAPNHFLTNATVYLSRLVFWVSYHDMVLLSELSNRILGLLQVDRSQSIESPQTTAVESPPVESNDIRRERFRLTIDGVRAVLIDDINDFHVPILDLVFDKFIVEVADWSSQIRFDTTLSLHANYFNLKNSHWEPFVEQWQFSVSAARQEDEFKQLAIDIFCKKKLELNMSHAFLSTVVTAAAALNTATTRKLSKRSAQYPYILKNRTGYPVHVWIDKDGSNLNTTISKIENGQDLGWKFDDWRTVRERSNQTSHRLCVQIHGPAWEALKGLAVDREGSTIHALRPSLNKVTHRLVCSVELKDRVKIVTFRSTTLICNRTGLQIEAMIVNRNRRNAASSENTFRIQAKDVFSFPIESSYTDSIVVRPFGLGYDWCSQLIYWQDFKPEQPAFLVICKALDPSKPSFRFQVNVHLNNSPNSSEYPYMDISFLSPFVLENLLPYDIKYIIFDKTTKQKHLGSLKKGSSDPLYTLDPTHLLALNIQVVGTELRQKEAVFITSAELQYPDDILVLHDRIDHQLNLKLKYSGMSEGANRRVKIYSPYILLNRTECEMSFSARSLITTSRIVGSQSARGGRGPMEIEPFMFSYSTFEPLRSRAQVKVENSEWSKPLSFEAVGSAFQVTAAKPSEKKNIYLGVDVKEGDGKYYLTKIVTFSPRFIIHNGMNESMLFRQSGTTVAVEVKSKESFSLMALSYVDNDLFELNVRLSNAMSDWSNGFSMTQLGTVYVKVGILQSTVEYLIKVDIALVKAASTITFSKQEGRWPLRIENNTDVDISLWQQLATTHYVIPRGTSLPYAWDHPSANHKRLVIEINGKEQIIDTSHLGKQRAFQYPIVGANRFGFLVIELIAEGPTTIVRLKHPPASTAYKRASLGAQPIEASVPVEAKVLKTVQLRMEGIGISLISRDMQEIAYASARTLVVVWTDTEEVQALSFSLMWLQIDNQMYGCINPIFMYPTVLPKEGKEEWQPVLMLSLCKSKDTSFGVDYYKWFTLLLQELSVDLDEDFLYALTDFLRFDSNDATLTTQNSSDALLFDSTPSNTSMVKHDDSFNLFFEKFLLHPMQVNMSFSRISNAGSTLDARPQSAGIMSFILEVLTMTIGNIHDAPIRLNALELEHPIVSAPQLIDLITRFYSQEILGQVHKVIGAADFLGNPVGLFNNVASGVSDMFYEPLHGFEITRPQDFGIGVARGASSLVIKTVFGVTDTLSKFTGSIGKGLSVITMDEKFQEKRRLANRNRPRHVVYGMTSGAASLIRSVTSGVTGVVSQPLKGAHEAGIEGFFKGLGKGLVGVVAKPMIGVMDLATSVSEGIKNTTTVFDTELDRQRLPRFVGKEKILQPYDHREALGQSWLKSIENGRYFRELYIAHLEIRIDDLVAIVTESRVLMARIKRLKIEWDMPFEELQIIRPETGGLALVSKTRQVAKARMIPCPDASSMEWFREMLEGAFTSYLHVSKPFE
ncbi:hypothetical protein BDEG_25446 [Batrachochytrium dendrobatidis JEL423]|uniref:Vacuolar protein sorting-associated protein n=1 Tax=Batrachochytrium dendrobatidis (strain JEL423) TaxID=403673 RepID=A0A177WP68_BATDL|nr:hypothetical protein BDEG_25446 [Batrachochytrium dendrobatidis JEL423]